MFSGIANIFGYLLNWLYNILGQNYGFALIVFTILLRIILLPMTIKQQKSVKKTGELQEKVKAIQFKYKNDPEKMNKEVMSLYKSENVSPLSGCLSTILQIIIIFSVFTMVSRPLTYVSKVDADLINNYKEEIASENGKNSNYYEIEIIQKKSDVDERVKINMDFLGLNLSKVPNQNLTDFTVYIIPILYVISSIISIKITTNTNLKKGKKEGEQSTEPDMTQQMSKSMQYLMPVMAVSIAFIAPLGLALYWFVTNLLMIIERVIIDKVAEKTEHKEVA